MEVLSWERSFWEVADEDSVGEWGAAHGSALPVVQEVEAGLQDAAAGVELWGQTEGEPPGRIWTIF